MKIIIFLILIVQIVISSDPYCTYGLISKNVCCDNSCNQCGEEGCSNEDLFIGSKCCINNIRESTKSCEDHYAPCIISNDKLPKEEPSKSKTRLSLAIIIVIIVSLTVLFLFINTGSNRKFQKRGYIEEQRDMFISQLNVDPLG